MNTRKPNRPKDVIQAERAANDAKRIAKLEARIAKLKREAVEKERRAAQKAANAEKARLEAEAIKARKAIRNANRDIDDEVCLWALQDVIEGMLRRQAEGKLTKRHEAKYARILVNRIAHEIPAAYSGKMSVAALKLGYQRNVVEKKGWGPTPEHFNPSQAMGHKIVDTFLTLGHYDPAVLAELLEEALQIHKVTPDENMALVKFQKTGVFIDADTAYAQCGIELIDWPSGSKWKDAVKMYPQYF